MPYTSAFDTGRYDRVARLFHWTIALLVIVNIVGGLFHDAIGKVVPIMPFHKATGILILALSIGRIAWRLTHPAPPLPAGTPHWERAVAHANHLIFYALILLMPLSGWVMSSAGPYPISFYGLFEVPKFAVTRESPIAGAAGQGHEVMGLIFAALVMLHIAAALRHHFVLKDAVLRRMM